MVARPLRMLVMLTVGTGAAYVVKLLVDERREEARLARPVRDWPDVPTEPPPSASGRAASGSSGAHGTGAPADTPQTAGPPSARGAGRPPAWVAPAAGACPDGYPVKAKVRSSVYHLPGMAAYARTGPDRCYATAEAAERDGFRRASH